MDFLENFYLNLVEFQKKHVWPILFLVLVVTGFFLFFALRLEVDSTLDQQLIPTDDYLTYKEVMSKEFGATDSFFVVIRTNEASPDEDGVRDMRDPKVIQGMLEIEKSLLKEPEVSSVTGISSVFKEVFGRAPNSIEESKEWLELLGPSAQAFFNKDKSATIMNVVVDIPNKPGNRDEVEARLHERVDAAPMPLGATASLTGFPTLLNRIIKLMINDSLVTLLVALVFVFAVMLYLYKKISYTLITFLPVIFAVIWLAGILEILGIKLSLSNATVGAMVIGLGVGYAIHVVNSFSSIVRKNESKPISRTMQVVGTALFLSYLTTFVGFGVNILGSTEAVRIQGFTLALGITLCYISTVVLVPVFLKLKIEILREEHGEHKWK